MIGVTKGANVGKVEGAASKLESPPPVFILSVTRVQWHGVHNKFCENQVCSTIITVNGN